MKGKGKGKGKGKDNGLGTTTRISLFTLSSTTVNSLGDVFITASTVIPGNSPGVTDPVKQSDAGLIAGATIVATIFILIAALVVYMCCCRCKQKDSPRKNSTYQMYSEVDVSQMVIPGHLRTINSPLYGKEDQKLDIIKDKNEIDDSDLNTNTQIDNVYEEISNENSINMDPRYINTSPIHDV